MDLTTTYLGMKLKNPLVVSSCQPLSNSLDKLKQAEDAGAAAVVMYSLYEEQINKESEELDYFLSKGSESFAEALSYFPEMDDYEAGPEAYLEHLQKAKQSLGIPVIGSLNGVSKGGWVRYAKKMQEAGADAIEINLYYLATDPETDCQAIEDMYVDVLKEVKQTVNVPVAMKLSPYFSSLFNFARRLKNAGADGLVLFNRFYQPDLDIEALEVQPKVSLSTPHEMRLPMRWIAILFDKIKLSLAATSGVHDAESVIKMVMAGADCTMIASELVQNGFGRLGEIENELKRWMEEHEYASIDLMKGSLSQRSCPEPAAFERANYMKTIQSYGKYLTV